MTKFIIFVWMCSSVAQQCIPGVVTQKVFDTYKDCAVFGYDYSSKILGNMSVEDMEKYRTTVLFECREDITT
tara:strand:+ start:477 stop:692 length:216 start_codon:yes stop_codon:yes gene_type:complete